MGAQCRLHLTSRWTLSVLVLSVVSVLLAIVFYSQHRDGLGALSDFPALKRQSVAAKGPTIVITETSGAHDEVLAALVEAFAGIEGANIEVFQTWRDRFGSLDILERLTVSSSLHPIRSAQDIVRWSTENPPPDIVVSTTCEYFPFEDVSMLVQQFRTRLFCVVHHTDRWDKGYWMWHLEKKLEPWLLADRVEFLALSNHTADSLQMAVSQWDSIRDHGCQARIHVFPPVFDLPPGPSTAADQLVADSSQQTESGDRLSFVLQGDYSPKRRDYSHVFQVFTNLLAALERRQDPRAQQVALFLVGHGNEKPEVPPSLINTIFFAESLNYTDFYGLLSGSIALIPAFADVGYLDNKASSSVPASVIAGAPLIANDELLEAYGYLDPGSVWTQNPGQGDEDALRYIIDQPSAAHMRVKANLKTLRRSLIKQNRELVRSVSKAKSSDSLQWK